MQKSDELDGISLHCLAPKFTAKVFISKYPDFMDTLYSKQKQMYVKSSEAIFLSSPFAVRHGLTFTKRQNFRPVQIESICRRHIKGDPNGKIISE